jgi:glycerol-3-phosphate dehydrogenase
MAKDALDLRDRDARFSAAEAGVFDLVVIGGGVTGAGVARDAAMRGLSVCLVEARDFAAGTSSRSSKMIHGGLRYMAQGDLGLVAEAASERKAVEAIAPHLTRLTPFVIPSKNAATTAKLRTGMWAFEKLGGVPKDRRHEVWGKAELAAREPAIDAADLSGAVAYPEYLTDDAKLTLANVRDAAAHGAVVLNYAPAARILMEGGRAVGVEIGDGLAATGTAADAGEARARVRGKVVVNAAGPWVDAVRALEDAAAPPRLKLTKGIHIVVPAEKLPVARTIIMPAADRRSVFAVPKGPMTYVGTTDTFYPQADVWPRIESADVDYLLAACARRFSVTPLTAGDIVSAWSGVRPLVAEEGKSASEISRRDEMWEGPGGVLSIAGGKLTAYRMMAERIVDAVETRLGRKPQRAATETTPLPGGDVDPKALAARIGDERLVGLYGAEAELVAADGGDAAAEARHAVTREGAVSLEDWWVRRSARAWFDPDLAALAPGAAAMAGLLGWSPDETARQIAACEAVRARNLNFEPETA